MTHCLLSVLTVTGVILLTGLNADRNGGRPGLLSLLIGVLCASPLLVNLLKHSTAY